jgi:hypothetical protein
LRGRNDPGASRRSFQAQYGMCGVPNYGPSAVNLPIHKTPREKQDCQLSMYMRSTLGRRQPGIVQAWSLLAQQPGAWLSASYRQNNRVRMTEYSVLRNSFDGPTPWHPPWRPSAAGRSARHQRKACVRNQYCNLRTAPQWLGGGPLVTALVTARPLQCHVVAQAGPMGSGRAVLPALRSAWAAARF